MQTILYKNHFDLEIMLVKTKDFRLGMLHKSFILTSQPQEPIFGSHLYVRFVHARLHGYHGYPNCECSIF